jgi:hypothetical protein
MIINRRGQQGIVSSVSVNQPDKIMSGISIKHID